MIRVEKLCEEHNDKFTNICIENHDCSDRRLCNQCVFKSHSTVPREKLPLIDDFKKSINDKLSQYNQENYKPILKNIEQLIGKVNNSLQQLRNFANHLIDSIKNFDKKYLEMQGNLKNTLIQEFSKGDIIFLTKILNGQYDKNEIRQQNIKEAFQKRLKKIQEICSSLYEKLFNLNDDVHSEELGDGVKLEGMKQNCLKLGDYYYIFPDGSKEFAGFYDYGLKQGVWRHKLGIDQNGLIDWEFVDYLNGQKTQSLCTYKQNMYYKTALGVSKKGLDVDNQGQTQGYVKETIKVLKQFNNCEISNYEINFFGEYKKGVRIGNWIIKCGEKTIGGGNYDEKGIKNGQWTDINECYLRYEFQARSSGEYKNGVRVGMWTTIIEEETIGGGLYDDKGIKTGEWTDPDERFDRRARVTHKGKYKNNVRVGQWLTAHTYFPTFFKEIYEIIGGGFYDDNGTKTGYWIELDEHYQYCFIITNLGEYKNGVRIGYWSIEHNNKHKIGGGNYDNTGIKIGQWTDLDECYTLEFQVTHKGEYMNGIRVGNWQSAFKGVIIGGGTYDDKGIKFGQWTDLDEEYRYNFQVTHKGKYENGVRVGKWSTTYTKDNDCEKEIRTGQWSDDFQNKIIGGDYYNNGQKIGFWKEKSWFSNERKANSVEYDNGKVKVYEGHEQKR